MDARIKACGAQNAYFPLFIPLSYFQREAEHVEGFSPELAVVTFAGGEELAEPIVVRPTSETVIGEFMAKWIQSYRDLPLLLNQWSNVVRWELRPRDCSCARASSSGRRATARTRPTRTPPPTRGASTSRSTTPSCATCMAMPTFLGIKPASERFPGAINSITAEGMMRDGKALQMATSHEIGQNFARAFDIYYQSEAGESTLCWTTSWGASTRLVGRPDHGPRRRRGLLVPPRLAAVQVVVIAGARRARGRGRRRVDRRGAGRRACASRSTADGAASVVA